MCCRDRYQTTVFELRMQQKTPTSSYFEAHIAATNLSLPQASLHTDALPDVRFAPDRRNTVGRGSLLAISLILLSPTCLALAYHYCLRFTVSSRRARRVAQGDLKGSASSFPRYDELAALAKDFDSMVIRLDSLIQNPKRTSESVSHELRSPSSRNQSLSGSSKKSLL